MRGRGFLARLSGSTAEFLSMWILMTLGPNLFYLEDETHDLRLRFLPALPRWLFVEPSGHSTGQTTDRLPRIEFKLFGSIDVTFHHGLGDKDLFRIPPSRYEVVFRDGSTFKVDGPSLPSDLADKVRRVAFVATIDAYFE